MRLVLLSEVVSEVCASSVTLSVLAGLPELCALELLVVDLYLLLLLMPELLGVIAVILLLGQ